MSGKQKEVSDLVDRLLKIKARQGEKFNIPSWMLDKSRYGKGSLTQQEKHEWVESICQSMRASVALKYLIECGERWGIRNGERVFKSGNIVFSLSQKIIENLLIVHVESALIEHRPEERYIAVFQFYRVNDQYQQRDGYSWFSDFLDDVFIALAYKIRNGETPEALTFH